MAYSSRGSSGRGAGGRSSSRGGGSRYGGGGGGKNSPMPMVLAGVGLIGVIALVVVMTKKSPPKEPEAPPPAATPAAAAPVKPKEPELGPKPALPPEIITRAKSLMPRVKEASAKGKKFYDDALAAKAAGDDDKWQQLMADGREVLGLVRDEWNEIEDQVETYLKGHPSKGWDYQMVIDSYLRAESGSIQRDIDEPMSKMKKTGH
jgi:hypothetical protein